MEDTFLQDLFDSVGPITTKNMFGGKGIYVQGRIIAVVMRDGSLLVKGDDVSAPQYEFRHMKRWTYTNKKSGKLTAMPYWHVPENALDDPDEMADLARLAHQTSLRIPVKLQR